VKDRIVTGHFSQQQENGESQRISPSYTEIKTLRATSEYFTDREEAKSSARERDDQKLKNPRGFGLSAGGGI